MECPTVKIASPVSEDNPLGFIVINESDFKDGEHTLFDEKAAAAAAEKAAAAAAEKAAKAAAKAVPK